MKSFQKNVRRWCENCFGRRDADYIPERTHRFLEESLELVQAIGCSAEDAHKLVDYVFARPQGFVNQEVGGVMITLAALCSAARQDMLYLGKEELARISFAPVMERIRAKHASKPRSSPLPGNYEPTDALLAKENPDENQH